jgi:hypothetical protein
MENKNKNKNKDKLKVYHFNKLVNIMGQQE